MKNREKYKKYIKDFYHGDSDDFCKEFVEPVILKAKSCGGYCIRCQMLQNIWLEEEYQPPATDWSKVPVDTPILVRSSRDFNWVCRHFAKYVDGCVYAFSNGETSWTHECMGGSIYQWEYAKLPDQEDPQ